MLTLLHLITGLETGGAEGMLARLVITSDRAQFRHVVVSMTGSGTAGPKIAEAGIALRSLELSRNMPNPVALSRLRRVLREFRPDILQTWLYHADFLGVAAWRLGWVPRLLWNVRCTETIGVAGIRRWLTRWSGLPDAVVVNSNKGKSFHEALGYRPRRWAHIPNGFDTTVLKPDAGARECQRRALGIGDDAFVVLLPARYHPMKDHATFLAAAALFAEARPEARFVMVGDGVLPSNGQLANMIAAYGVADRLLLLGERPDLASLYSAADVVTLSSSFGEGFPNVLAEAMCCGVACVATRIGDAADIIGATGAIVPPRDPAGMAVAWEAMAAAGPEKRRAMGDAARGRIVENYDLDTIVAQYAAVYQETVKNEVRTPDMAV